MDENKIQERAIYKSTLQEILEKIQERLEGDPRNITLKYEGKSIGILEYKKKNIKKVKKLYSISMVIDKTDVDYIYAEDGDMIAFIEKKSGKIIKDSDIEFNEQELKNNINPPENDKVKNFEKGSKLDNLVEKKINVDNSAAIIDLYRTIYNGRRLRDVLRIDSKLRDRVPDGASIEHLNYLGIVNSKELTAKDRKSRDAEFTCVIMDDPRNPKYMVELDENILKPRESLSKYENIAADRESKHIGDGEEKKGTSTTTNTRQIATFDIPGSGEDIGQSNDLISLEIRLNTKYIDESTSQRNDAHNIEFYLGVQDYAESQQEQQKGLKMHSVKLEAYDEVDKILERDQKLAFANYYGVDDEYKNEDVVKDTELDANEIKEIIPTIETSIKGEFNKKGMDIIKERDANEINKIMKEEIVEHVKKVTLSGKTKENITSEITKSAEKLVDFYDLAKEISNEYDDYSTREIFLAILNRYKENKEIQRQEMKEMIIDSLNQRVIGDNVKKHM